MASPFRPTPRRLVARLGLGAVLAATVTACDPAKLPPTLPTAATACDVQTPGSEVCAAPTPAPAPALPKVMINPVRKGVLATDLTMLDVDGKSHKLSEYKGKFIVLTAFAYWCPHCHKQLPRLEREVATRLAGKDVVFIGIEANGGQADQVKDMAKTHDIKQPLYLDPTLWAEKAFMPFGFPTMYLISPDFKIHGFVAGEVDSISMADEIEKLLGVSPVQTQDWPPIEAPNSKP